MATRMSERKIRKLLVRRKGKRSQRIQSRHQRNAPKRPTMMTTGKVESAEGIETAIGGHRKSSLCRLSAWLWYAFACVSCAAQLCRVRAKATSLCAKSQIRKFQSGRLKSRGSALHG